MNKNREKLFPPLEKITPAMILSDLEMPGMNGYFVMRALKKKDFATKPFSRKLPMKRIESQKAAAA